LNSRLVEFWLLSRGKRQGSNFQIDKEPLMRIPIMVPDKSAEREICKLVNCIIAATINSRTKESIAFEAEIDQLVYQLYGLTEEEISIVEGASGGSKKLEVGSKKSEVGEGDGKKSRRRKTAALPPSLEGWD
jgi:uncharacterized protein YggU (UPF0235/DUF167 family)